MKQFLLVNFLLLICSIKCISNSEDINWTCDRMDIALIRFHILNLTQQMNLTVNYQYEICNKCNLSHLKTVQFDPASQQKNDYNLTIDSYYSYIFEVEVRDNIELTSKLICPAFIYRKLGECGVYDFQIINTSESTYECKIVKIQNSQQSELWLILGVGLVLIFMIITNLVEKYQKPVKDFFFKKFSKPKVKIINEDTSMQSIEAEIKKEEESQQKNLDTKKNPTIKTRLQALDTFRGLSLFLMIFVNYGSGGYKFVQHVPWHGVTLADFVFPWFLWIMGFSIPLSTHSLLNKPNANRWSIFSRILLRSIKMFLIGLILNSRFGVELVNLRIFGVLQRIAMCYFIVATIELIFYTKIELDNSTRNLKYYT